MNTILPTRTCFDDVLEHQVALARRDPTAAARQRIVHGICLLPEPDGNRSAGEPFAHAWVEDQETLEVWQSGLLADGRKVWFAIAAAEFLDKLRVQSSTRYSLDQARILNWQTGHYGPWVPGYRAFCRNQRVR